MNRWKWLLRLPALYWLYDLLEDEGFEVRLSHPLKTKL